MWAVGRLSLLSRGLAVGRGLAEPKDLRAVEAAAVPSAPPVDVPPLEAPAIFEEPLGAAVIEVPPIAIDVPSVVEAHAPAADQAAPAAVADTPTVVAEVVPIAEASLEVHTPLPATDVPEQAIVGEFRSAEIPTTEALAERLALDEAPTPQKIDALDCPSPDVDGWDPHSRVADSPVEAMPEVASKVVAAVVPVVAVPEPLVERTLADLKPADPLRETPPPAAPQPEPPLAPVSAPSFFRRIVIKVKSFFRSLFG
ncbi:MAG: hypothetical protein ABI672_20055 [Vicinamibacteria bacterium]